jgi:hypothetical protein
MGDSSDEEAPTRLAKEVETKLSVAPPEAPPRNPRPEDSRDICAVCGEAGASSYCAACRKASYCSRSCQKRHWRSGHKADCTQDCVVLIRGQVMDGEGSLLSMRSSRKTQFELRETLPKTALVSEWADRASGMEHLEALLERIKGRKNGLRNDWRCHCGRSAKRLKSDIHSCIVARQIAPPWPLMVFDRVSFAVCGRKKCEELSDLILEKIGHKVQAKKQVHGTEFVMQLGGYTEDDFYGWGVKFAK